MPWPAAEPRPAVAPISPSRPKTLASPRSAPASWHPFAAAHIADARMATLCVYPNNQGSEAWDEAMFSVCRDLGIDWYAEDFEYHRPEWCIPNELVGAADLEALEGS